MISRARRWRPAIIARASLLALLAPMALASLRGGPVPAGAQPAAPMAPDFTLQLFDGKSLSLKALRGRPVVLNFWASW